MKGGTRSDENDRGEGSCLSAAGQAGREPGAEGRMDRDRGFVGAAVRRGRIRADGEAAGRQRAVSREHHERERRCCMGARQRRHRASRRGTGRAHLHGGRRGRQEQNVADGDGAVAERERDDRTAGGVSKLGGRGAQGRGERGDGGLQDALRGQRDGALVQVGRSTERLYRHGYCRDRPEGRYRPQGRQGRTGRARQAGRARPRRRDRRDRRARRGRPEG